MVLKMILFLKDVPLLLNVKKRAPTLLNLANKLLGVNLGDDTLILGTSGRYEFKNKGINVYLEALNRLTRDKNLKKRSTGVY